MPRVLAVQSGAGFCAEMAVRYNGAMPKIRRTARVTIMVTPAMKKAAQRIAAAMTTEEQRWTETDAWEQGIAYLLTRKDIREALAAQSDQAAQEKAQEGQ